MILIKKYTQVAMIDLYIDYYWLTVIDYDDDDDCLCKGWSLRWESPWPSSTSQWSGSPLDSTGRGCCCSEMFVRGSSTPCCSPSGSSSAENISWWGRSTGFVWMLDYQLWWPVSVSAVIVKRESEISARSAPCCGLCVQDQTERNRLSIYWKQVGPIVFGSFCLFIFDMCERWDMKSMLQLSVIKPKCFTVNV